jgi:hypothetical protein
VSRASTRRWQERDLQRKANATAARRLAGLPVEPAPGTGLTDGPERSEGNVDAIALQEQSSCNTADPYVLAETIVAYDGTEIHVWAPRSAVEALYPKEPGR